MDGNPNANSPPRRNEGRAAAGRSHEGTKPRSPPPPCRAPSWLRVRCGEGTARSTYVIFGSRMPSLSRRFWSSRMRDLPISRGVMPPSAHMAAAVPAACPSVAQVAPTRVEPSARCVTEMHRPAVQATTGGRGRAARRTLRPPRDQSGIQRPQVRQAFRRPCSR